MAAPLVSALANCPPGSSHSWVRVSVHVRLLAHAEYHHVHNLQYESGPPTKEAALLLHDGGL
jgi:hypothetical protein